MPTNLFAALHSWAHHTPVRANHTDEFIRRYSPIGGANHADEFIRRYSPVATQNLYPILIFLGNE